MKLIKKKSEIKRELYYRVGWLRVDAEHSKAYLQLILVLVVFKI